jgi:hypothetical protein
VTDPQPFTLNAGPEAKRHAPATARNRDAIAEILTDALPTSGTVLEIASGTGEHIVHFAGAFPHLLWQPSDHDALGLESISAWSAEAGLPNLLPPVLIDASAPDWPVARADALLCINMVHIAPWVATQGLMAGAERLLPKGAPLILYGPYIVPCVETAASNLAFDANLRAQSPDWGLRDLTEVEALAAAHGLLLDQRIEMPANNLSLIFLKSE